MQINPEAPTLPIGKRFLASRASVTDLLKSFVSPNSSQPAASGRPYYFRAETQAELSPEARGDVSLNLFKDGLSDLFQYSVNSAGVISLSFPYNT